MNREQLAELLRYSSPYSIWVVTYKNEIVELHCPFWVLVRGDVGELKKGDREQVEIVKLSYELKTVFVVLGKPYYYYHFEILLKKIEK
tara:strand:- start:108 stop:371 length:264 start_codon:yes stop_codon:yes gene_type:complete